MMFTFKKFSKNLKRTVSGVLCLIVLSSLLVIPAGAADSASLSGTLFTLFNNTLGASYIGAVNVGSQFPVVGLTSSPVFSTTNTAANVMRTELGRFSFSFNTPIVLDGPAGVYLSFYLQSNFTGAVSSPDVSLSDFRVYTSDGLFTRQSLGDVSVSTFGVSPVDGASNSTGYLLRGRTSSLDSIIPVTSLYFEVPPSGRVFTFSKPAGVPGAITFMCPSVSVVTGLSSGDLTVLEGVADGIAAQSQIMSAFYGDIMSLLNDIYSRLGDLKAVQETANAYFAQLIPLVNSISTNTANIYSLLQTQFQLLRTLIATESDDIQAAIEQQTDDLIAYFDTVFSDAVGDMPEKTDDLNQSVGDVSDAESNYQSTATQRFDQLIDTFSGGFSGGTLAGVTLAATLFSRVWNALGDYVIVYTWPLFLGLCLVILGRMSRLSGGQSSSEKHRGDSDA